MMVMTAKVNLKKIALLLGAAALVIITLIAMVLENFMDIVWVQHAFAGIRAGVIALICKALINMYKKAPKDKISLILMGASFALAVLPLFVNFRINAVYIIIAAAIVGIISAVIAGRKAEK